MIWTSLCQYHCTAQAPQTLLYVSGPSGILLGVTECVCVCVLVCACVCVLYRLSVIASTLGPTLSIPKLAAGLSFFVFIYLFFLPFSCLLGLIFTRSICISFSPSPFLFPSHPSSLSRPVIVTLCQPGDTAVLASIPSPLTHTHNQHPARGTVWSSELNVNLSSCQCLTRNRPRLQATALIHDTCR